MRTLTERRAGWGALLIAATCLLSAYAPGLALAASPAPVLPASDPFYSYAGPLKGVAPGTVLKRRAVTLSDLNVSMPLSATQVLYRSTGQLGQPATAVATIVRPLASTGTTKLLSYQWAYDALGSQCDPSYNLRGGDPGTSTTNSIEEQIMTAWVAAGYTVVVPDYEGVTMDWLAGQEEGYNTLDGIRAAESTMGLRSSTTPVGLLGYSGASIPSVFAAELAPAYAPELDIVGSAAGGVPVDLAHLIAYTNGSSNWAGVIPAALVGIARAFHVNLDQYLSAYGRQIARRVADECISSFQQAYPGLTIEKLLTPQYQNWKAVPALAKMLNPLIMGNSGTPKTSMFLAVANKDGTGDGVIVSADDEALAHEYCRRGVTVQFDEYHGFDHITAIPLVLLDAVTFLGARLNGLQVAGNCTSIPAGGSLAPLPIPSSPPAPRCPAARGRLTGAQLGPVKLGMTLEQARAAFRGSSTRTNRARRTMVEFCLAGRGIETFYPSAELLRSLSRTVRGKVAGRVVLALTANKLYAIDGVRVGTTVAAAAPRLHAETRLQIGRNTWQIVALGSHFGLVVSQHGMIEALGIADPRLLSPLARARGLLSSFG